MIDLDDRQALSRVDRDDMRNLLLEFPEQVARARALETELPSFDAIEAIAVCGMGGSAIGGDFLSTYLERQDVTKPITVVRNYRLPPSVNEKTLVMAVSYSGNTEETLSCAREALSRKSPLVAVTSDGELAELLREHDARIVLIPGGMPPRTALGYLFVPLLEILEPHLSANLGGELEEAVGLLQTLAQRYADAPEEENEAKRLARAFHERIPVVYGSDRLTDVVARRWKTQINENAKAPAYYDALPELHHNEIMSWNRNEEGRALSRRFVHILLRDRDEHPQIERRFRISREILKHHGREVREVHSEGEGLLARLFSLAHLGDWASYYLAMLYEVDPTPVELIEELKRRLAES